MNFSAPTDINKMSCFTLAKESLARFKYLIDTDFLPFDIIEQLEDNVIPALQYIEGWEPSYALIQDHIDSRGMF
jgi:hypothetical protein